MDRTERRLISSQLAQDWHVGRLQWYEGTRPAIVIDAMSKGANITIAAAAAQITRARLDGWLRSGRDIGEQYELLHGEQPDYLADLIQADIGTSHQRMCWQLVKDIEQQRAQRALQILDDIGKQSHRDWRAGMAWLDRVFPQETHQATAQTDPQVSNAVAGALDRVAGMLEQSTQPTPADDDITDAELVDE